LAPVLVQDPAVIGLDEPSSGLDPVAVASLSETPPQRARSGCTLSFSSYQLDLVQDLCEDIVMLDYGELDRDGEPCREHEQLREGYSADGADEHLAGVQDGEQYVGTQVDFSMATVVAAPDGDRGPQARGRVVRTGVCPLRVPFRGRCCPRRQDYRGQLGHHACHDPARRRLHVSITVVTADPSGPWSAVLSMSPPHRAASDADPVGPRAPVHTNHLALAMTLTADTAILLAFIASSIYRRALLISGRRVRLRERTGRGVT
jgi:hypothetical protein